MISFPRWNAGGPPGMVGVPETAVAATTSHSFGCWSIPRIFAPDANGAYAKALNDVAADIEVPAYVQPPRPPRGTPSSSGMKSTRFHAAPPGRDARSTSRRIPPDQTDAKG